MSEPFGLEHVRRILKKIKARSVTVKDKRALLWAANEAVNMTGGGPPDDFLCDTPEAKEIACLAAKYKVYS